MRRKRSPVGRRRGVVCLHVSLLSLLAATAIPSTALARDTRDILLQDRCHPVTFNAVQPPIPGGCVGDGNVTFQELLASANPHDGGHRGWRFSREETDLKRGQRLVVTNVGGEVHSFTEVVSFGAGIVPPLNAALPPGTRDAKPVPGDQHFLLQGQGLDLTLSPGRHLFQCLIHPWMRSVVDQRQ
jgi:hypothetical protein